MKGKIILFAIMFLATMAGALAVKDITTDYTPISVVQNSNGDFVVSITNSGDETISVIDLALQDFTLNSNSFSGNLNTSQINNLAAGESVDVEISLNPGLNPAGTYAANFEIDLDSQMQTTTLEVEVLVLDSDLSTPGSVTFNIASGDSSATKTFTITNNGDVALNDLILSTSIQSQYAPSISPTSIASLAVGESRTITLNIEIPSGLDTRSTLIGTVNIQNDLVSKSINVLTKAESKLAVNDIEIKVGNDRTKDMQDGDVADDEAAPGDEITLEFEVENLFSDDEDIDIEDIEVELTVKDIDDGDDIELDANEFDLDAEKTEDVKFTFTVPFIVDEERYALEVHIEGEDDEGTLHELDFVVYIEVEKESHELRIERVEVSPSTISCLRTTSVEVSVVNTGSDDEDVRVSVSSRGLNFESEREFELEEGDDSDSRRSTSFSIPVDEEQTPGIYSIQVEVFRGNSREASEDIQLEVRNCEARDVDSNTPSTPPTFEVEQSGVGVSIPTTTRAKSPLMNLRESDLYLGGLGILVVLLALVVFIVLPRLK